MADEVKGFNIKIGLDSSQMTEELKRVSGELNAQKAKLTSINKQLKYDPKNINVWKQKQSELNRMLEQTKVKLAALKKQADLALSSGDTRAFNSLNGQIVKVNGSIDELNGELTYTKNKISSLNQARWTSLESAGSALSKISMAAIGAGTALVALETKVISSLGDISDQASELGLTAEQYQRLVYAANSLGVSTTTLNAGFEKTSSILGDLATGNGLQAAQTLTKLGLSYEEISKMGTEDAFSAISDALMKVTDESERLGLANSLFGDKLGTKLMPMIEAGTATIKDLEGQATVSTDEEVASAKKIENEMAIIKGQLTAAASEWVPDVLDAVKALHSFVSENVVPIMTKIHDWFNSMDDGQKKAVAALAGIAVSVGPVLTVVGKLGSSIGGLLGTAGGSTGLLGLVAAHPVVAAAVVALGALFGDAYANDEKFRGSVDELVKSVMNLAKDAFKSLQDILTALKPVWDALEESFKKIFEDAGPLLNKSLQLTGKWLSLIASSISSVIMKLTSNEGLNNAFSMLGLIVSGAFDLISKAADDLMPVWDALNAAFSAIADITLPLLDASLNEAGGWLSGIANTVKSVIDVLTGKISLRSAFENVGNYLSTTFKEVIDSVTSWFTGLWQNLYNFWNWIQSTLGMKKSSITNGTDVGDLNTGDGTEVVNAYRPASSTSNHISNVYTITINTSASKMDITDINNLLGQEA